jgi:hypothetical protein
MPFPKGKVVALEKDLKSEGWLPNHPGTYTIVFTWCTSTGTVDQTLAGWTAHLSPYATVEARATIHIVAEGPPS